MSVPHSAETEVAMSVTSTTLEAWFRFLSRWSLKNPASYRLFATFDTAVWLALGGFFIVLGVLLAPLAPIRSTLVTACGIGQVAGSLGSMVDEGVPALADYFDGSSRHRCTDTNLRATDHRCRPFSYTVYPFISADHCRFLYYSSSILAW
jgi:hypothetical protein